MLTLQQLLESDSLATIVAKLNNNFQILNATNGGPQGIRGQQGIPGLPGRVGPLGPTGAQGPTGTLLGIIPFAKISASTAGVGPTSGQLAPNSQPAGEWPLASWTWLMNYHGAGITSSFPGFSGGTGATAKPGDIYVDHANKGYWKYLEAVDATGAYNPGTGTYPAEYLSGGIYGVAGTGSYPDFSAGFGFLGNGWYWYSTEDISNVLGGNVWVNDITTYLFSPTAAGPYPGSTAIPLSIPNARLESKYGSVWITSGNDLGGDDNLPTTTIEAWGGNTAGFNPSRVNSGIDRLLFKMSIDTIPYLGNITARGFTGLSGPAYSQSSTYPESANGTAMQFPLENTYWVKPQYETTIEKFSPLIFLSERNIDAVIDNSSSLGLYMHTSQDAGGKSNLNKSLFLWSSRYSPDPVEMYPAGFTGIDSASTKNYGEFIMDTRRLIASNQYVCSSPTDMKLSGDWIDYITGPEAYYEESNVNNSYRYRTFQGYISSINGKSITGNPNAVDYWEYGLGDGTTYGLTGGTHDTASGLTGMQTRNTWYGSSVFDDLPSNWDGLNPGEGNYIRVAGMMDRGRRFDDLTDVAGVGTGTNFLSELVFYTSHFKFDLAGGTGLTKNEVDPTQNSHKSLPVMYMSPYRNIGIGTFVGDTSNTADAGPLEPAGQLHVHVKQKLREDDPTYTYVELAGGSKLPDKVFTVAAFSGDYLKIADNSVTDILLGNLYTQTEEWVNPTNAIGDVVNRMSDNDTVPGANVLRNAIRTESWRYSRHNTMHLGAQSILSNYAIGKEDSEYFKTQFQISIHPLIKDTTLDESDSNQSISGVGLHNLYPRTRIHLFGKNIYNEVDWGEENWTPGVVVAPSGVTNSYPYYPGKGRINSPSENQIAIDYLGDSYTYPVGIYEYQYYAYGATANPGSTGTLSPNAAVYPSKDKLTPTRHAVPFEPDYVNFAYPATGTNVTFNNSYRHGGTTNAWWEPTSYIGFNLIRDVSEAGTGSTGGDNRDNTRWLLGRDNNANDTTGNNGGSAIISSPHGELGIINIPRGRDGGHPYTQWEQRGLGTRDVLNQMKIVFDKNGNIAVGNAAGWDMDAYPSLDRDANGYLQYVPTVGATATVPATAGSGLTYTWDGRWNTANGQYGLLTYSGYAENATTSSAALINSQATQAEYIRLEIAAEKAWSRDGRMAQKTGWGYPPSTTISLTVGVEVADYINLSLVSTGFGANWSLVTDSEGRIIDSVLNLAVANPGIDATFFPAVVYPHPTEFNAGGPLSGLAPGFTAPVGAIAAEWWGMSVDHPAEDLNDTIVVSGGNSIVTFIPTTDLRGSANIRLNNFVYGEGYGFGGPGGQTADAVPDDTDVADFTKNLVKQKRQESPKLIFTFLEGDVDSGKAALRGVVAGQDPYKKVSTVIQSAQDEVSLREYWIPKADNTGGTFMVFTDHFGSKEKTDGFDATSIKVTTTGTGGVTGDYGLHLDQVVTMEFLAGYTGAIADITNTTDLTTNIDGNASILLDNMYPGFVRYSNRDYTWPGQQDTAFTSSQYGRKLAVGVADSTTDILQLGATRDGQYSIFNISNPGQPTTNQIINNSSKNGSNIADRTAANAVLIKTDTSGLNSFDVDLIEDSDYSYTPSTGTGSVTSSVGATELQFQPTSSPSPDLITPDRIKVTIDLAAAGATGTDWQNLGPLYIGLIPDDGNFSMDHMVTSCLTNGYFGTIWPTDGPDSSSGVVFENQISFYISNTNWSLNSNSPWKLGMMLRQSGDFQISDPADFLTTTDVLRVTNFKIKFEEVYNPADTQTRNQETDILPVVGGANLSAVQRNIDHYYSIESFTVDPTLGDNQASAIRFKRINSEFALVDFNITVKVNNPVLPGGTATNSFNYIDFCSPRFTQYLRFIYVPDEDFSSEPTYRQDIAQDIYGNGMWFSNWSTYKQWYAGTAVVGNETTARSYYSDVVNVGEDLGPGFKTTTSDGSPFFTEPATIPPKSGAVGFRTWTGNYLDVLGYYVFGGAARESSIYKSEGNITPITAIYSSPTFSILVPGGQSRSGVYSAFGNDRRILQIAKAMFNQVDVSSEVGAKQSGFVQFLGAAYSLWHNHTYMRNKNIQWRMVPAQSYKYQAGASATTLTQNNTFVLEVQFSDPMLHVDTPLGERAFIGTGTATATDRFYQYLTVSGQSIVRYAETLADGNPIARNITP
jgi:hypothetical protein